MEKLILMPNLIGSIFIIAGLVMLIFPPKKINTLYGYRTPRSMKNIDNWNFAQQFSAKLMLIGGFVILFIGIVETIINLDEIFINISGFITLILFTIVLIIITENKIKKFEKSL
ncbi:MAG: SdpI family protein [Chryseobacterium sp.]|nr:SdpI family protein [Chryseobacterium sp.]